jgi:hypothetical protein
MSDHPWFVRETFLCPNCSYDVGQTLEDGFSICPECGTEIDPERCTRDVAYISDRTRALIYAVWLLPPLLLWATVAAPRLLVGTVAGSAVLVYATWVGIERWLERPGAWRRAIGPALAVLALDLVLAMAGGLIWILVVATR